MTTTPDEREELARVVFDFDELAFARNYPDENFKINKWENADELDRRDPLELAGVILAAGYRKLPPVDDARVAGLEREAAESALPTATATIERLRDALEKIEQQLAYGQFDSALRIARAALTTEPTT